MTKPDICLLAVHSSQPPSLARRASLCNVAIKAEGPDSHSRTVLTRRNEGTVERRDGRQFTVPVSVFSAADQEYPSAANPAIWYAGKSPNHSENRIGPRTPDTQRSEDRPKMFTRERLFIVAQTVGSLLLVAACTKAASPDASPRPPQAETEEGRQAAVPGKLIFYDGFEYEVQRDERNARPAFISQGKWSGVKSENATGRGLGYLYTAIASRATRAISRPEFQAGVGDRSPAEDVHNQTDFYLQYGGPRDKADAFRRTSGSSSGSIRTTMMTPRTRKISSADSAVASNSSIRVSMAATPRIPPGCSRWAGQATWS